MLRFDSLHEYELSDSGITIPVELSFADEGCTVISKLDTGSTFCIFQREYAEILGLTVENGYRQRIETAAGGFYAYGHEVSVTALDITHNMQAFFAENYEFPRNVLGQVWMQRMRLGIIHYDGHIYSSIY